MTLNPITTVLTLFAFILWTIALVNVPVNPIIAALALARHLIS